MLQSNKNIFEQVKPLLWQKDCMEKLWKNQDCVIMFLGLNLKKIDQNIISSEILVRNFWEQLKNYTIIITYTSKKYPAGT